MEISENLIMLVPPLSKQEEFAPYRGSTTGVVMRRCTEPVEVGESLPLAAKRLGDFCGGGYPRARGRRPGDIFTRVLRSERVFLNSFLDTDNADCTGFRGKTF